MKKSRKSPMKAMKMTPLEKQLADALVEVWEMLPMDLELVYTEDSDYYTVEKVVEISDRASDALGAAEKAGWKRPS